MNPQPQKSVYTMLEQFYSDSGVCMNRSSISSFIWGTADLLLGSLKQYEYGDIILPFTVLRRLDTVLRPTNQAL